MSENEDLDEKFSVSIETPSFDLNMEIKSEEDLEVAKTAFEKTASKTFGESELFEDQSRSVSDGVDDVMGWLEQLDQELTDLEEHVESVEERLSSQPDKDTREDDGLEDRVQGLQKYIEELEDRVQSLETRSESNPVQDEEEDVDEDPVVETGGSSGDTQDLIPRDEGFQGYGLQELRQFSEDRQHGIVEEAVRRNQPAESEEVCKEIFQASFQSGSQEYQWLNNTLRKLEKDDRVVSEKQVRKKIYWIDRDTDPVAGTKQLREIHGLDSDESLLCVHCQSRYGAFTDLDDAREHGDVVGHDSWVVASGSGPWNNDQTVQRIIERELGEEVLQSAG